MAKIKNSDLSCSVEGCPGRVVGRGMCSMHYQRVKKGKAPGPASRKIAERGGASRHCCGNYRQCPAAKKMTTHLDYVRNTDLFKRRARESALARVDEVKKRNAARYQNNKSHVMALCKAWRKANPERYRATNARSLAAYRAYIRQATPPWVDWSAIDAIYAACPKGWHVDHVIPLRHPLVCGLHVPANLQHLPASVNCSKRNTFDPALAA